MDFEHVLDELYSRLNQIRLHPRETAAYLTQLKSSYKGNLFKNKVKTRQGPNALMDLIGDFAQRNPVLNRLKWSFALHMAADDQAQLLGQKGLFTTEGTQYNRTLPQRVRDYAIVRGRISQVYQFGGRTPQQILEELLIDDGLISRKRRNTLMDPIYKYIGIGSSYHETNQACTVIILAEDIISLVAPDAAGKYRKRKGFETGKQNVIKLTDQIMINNTMGQLVFNAVDASKNNNNPQFSQSNATNNMLPNNLVPQLAGSATNSSATGQNPNLNTSFNSLSYHEPTPIPGAQGSPSFNKQPQFILTQNPAVFDNRYSNQTPINNLISDGGPSYANNTAPHQLQAGYMNDSRGSLAPSQYGNVMQPANMNESRGSLAPSQTQGAPIYVQDSRASLAPSQNQGTALQSQGGPTYMQDSRGSLAPSQSPSQYLNTSQQQPRAQTNYPPTANDPSMQSQYNSNPSFGQNSVIQPMGENVQYATPGDSRMSNQSLVPPLQANQSQNISSQTYNPNTNTNMNMNTSAYSNTNTNSPARNTNYPAAQSTTPQQSYMNENRQGSVVTYEPRNTNVHPEQFSSGISNNNLNTNFNNTNMNSSNFNNTNSYVVPKTINNSSIAQSELQRQQQEQYNYYKLPDNNIGGLATTEYRGPATNPATTPQKKDSKCTIM